MGDEEIPISNPEEDDPLVEEVAEEDILEEVEISSELSEDIGGYNELWEYTDGTWNELNLNIDESISDHYQVIDIIKYNDDLLILTKKHLVVINEEEFVFSIPISAFSDFIVT